MPEWKICAAKRENGQLRKHQRGDQFGKLQLADLPLSDDPHGEKEETVKENGAENHCNQKYHP